MVNIAANDNAAIVVPSPSDTTMMTTAQLLQLIESLMAKTDKTLATLSRHGEPRDH
jgi:hypothetical protein